MKKEMMFAVFFLLFLIGCTQPNAQTADATEVVNRSAYETQEGVQPVEQKQRNRIPTPTFQNQPINQDQRNCISNPAPQFTTSFIDITKIQQLTPIGGIMVGSQSRSYIFTKQKQRVPIYAPANSTVTGIVYAYRGDPAQGARAEYRVDLEVSCEVHYWFDHLTDISDRLKEYAPTKAAYNTHNNNIKPIPIKEGELIGYTQGGDFVVFNSAKIVPHINPKRWTSEHNLYADCPYDYFIPELKKQYYNLFASASGYIPQEKTCRNASRDVEGTLSGAWFQGDATDIEGPHLYIANDFTMVDLVKQAQSGQNDYGFRLRDMTPAKYPHEIHIGDSICYSDQQNYAYFKVIDKTHIQVIIASGNCPSTIPHNGWETWER